MQETKLGSQTGENLAEENTGGIHPEHKRKLTALEKLGVASATGTGLIASFATYSAIKAHFYTREEGDAVAKAIRSVEARVVELNAEQTRVVERKVDKILEFMKEDRAQAQRDVDRFDRRLENVEFVVMKSNPKGGK